MHLWGIDEVLNEYCNMNEYDTYYYINDPNLPDDWINVYLVSFEQGALFNLNKISNIQM